MKESKHATAMRMYLGADFDVERATAQGWHIRHNDQNIALITDEAIIGAYTPRKEYTHDTDCLYHPDNAESLEDYYNSYDRSPGGCDCPYKTLPPYGFSIIEMMLRRVKERVEERKMMKLRQVGRMCGSDPNV